MRLRMKITVATLATAAVVIGGSGVITECTGPVHPQATSAHAPHYTGIPYKDLVLWTSEGGGQVAQLQSDANQIAGPVLTVSQQRHIFTDLTVMERHPLPASVDPHHYWTTLLGDIHKVITEQENGNKAAELRDSVDLTAAYNGLVRELAAVQQQAKVNLGG